MLAATLLLFVSPLSAGPIVISDTKQDYRLLIVNKGQLLVDIDDNMDLNAARGTDHGWTVPDSDAFNFGYSTAGYWARWRITNGTHQPLDMVIDLGNPREDHVTWYLEKKGGYFHHYATGDRQPFSQRPVDLARNFALPMRLEAQEQVTVYLHLQSHDGFFEPMPVTLYRENAFFKESNLYALILSLYIGGLLFLMLYNFLLFFSTKERSFLIYVGYLSCFAMWNFTVNGFSFQYLWPESPVFNNHFLTFCSAYAFGLFGLFTIEYLRLPRYAPRRLIRVIQLLSALNFAVIIPSFMDYYAFSVAYGQIVGVAITGVTLGTGIWLLIKGQRQARFFMAAFTMLGGGVTIYIFKIIGMAPTNFLTTWGVQFGSSFEALILALGLADSMNILKQEKLEAERRAREAQETLAIGLEQQVQQRTQELATANRRLKALAITDELTGAYNRRHFNTICSAALHQKQRNEPLAFCMFDIDYFKRFNDQYGHSSGDDALQRVAQAVQDVLKRSGDALFRLGGEEFGVLYTANTEAKAFLFAEKMRDSIYQLGITHEANPEGQLTASFGVTHWNADESINAERIYSDTDSALYTAKGLGRNTVYLKKKYSEDANV